MSTTNRVELSCGHVYFMFLHDFLLSRFPLLSQLNGKLLNQYAKQQGACGRWRNSVSYCNCGLALADILGTYGLRAATP